MLIGKRLRALRESKKLSQGDIERRTGLVRVYTSRVENGHIVPGIETLEKYARALEVPMYKLFYDGRAKPETPLLAPETTEAGQGGGRAAREFQLFMRLLPRMKERDRALLLAMAQWMASRNRRA
jgi:transcriptional regulator with XRE-family HTH domain